MHLQASEQHTEDAEFDRQIMNEISLNLALAEKWCTLLAKCAANRTPIALAYAARRAESLIEHVELLFGALGLERPRDAVDSLRRLRVELEAFRPRKDQ